MKRKVGTVLDGALYRRVQDLARRQGRSASALIEEALERLTASGAPRGSAVAETKGIFKVTPAVLRAVLDEDLYGAG